MKFVVICNVILSSSEDLSQHLGGAFPLHLQGKTAKMQAAGNYFPVVSYNVSQIPIFRSEICAHTPSIPIIPTQ